MGGGKERRGRKEGRAIGKGRGGEERKGQIRKEEQRRGGKKRGLEETKGQEM